MRILANQDVVIFYVFFMILFHYLFLLQLYFEFAACDFAKYVQQLYISHPIFVCVLQTLIHIFRCESD